MILKILSIFLLCFLNINVALAGVQVDAVYPYSLDKKVNKTVAAGSTMPLYLNITAFDVPEKQPIKVTVNLPEGFKVLQSDKWQVGDDGSSAYTNWLLPADYGNTFDLLYIKPAEDAVSGTKQININITAENWQQEKIINFDYDANTKAENSKSAYGKKYKNKDYNWYIQDVDLPVDNLGHKDDRSADNVVYIRDTAFESFRSRLTGDGAESWSSMFNHPAAFMLVDMRNPQQDVRVLRLKAELLDKATGKVMPGLCQASNSTEEHEQGWAGKTDDSNATKAMISLDGKQTQAFIIPLYVDYFKIIEGDYTLRVTVEGNGQQKIQELPVKIEQKHSIGIAAVTFAFICFAAVLLFLPRLRRVIFNIGAQGAITVALFSAVGFGVITVPTTLAGEFLHVFLGPFSGFITGILSGVLQYLLIVSLLMLYRRQGVLALMFLTRYMLSGLLFGNFTPLGFLSCCVYIGVLEIILKLCGFFDKKNINVKYMLFIAAIFGVGDAVVTFINLEQMMFFYRLYYADWYIGLYMLINGFLYSSIGAWIGYKLGLKLQRVTGE